MRRFTLVAAVAMIACGLHAGFADDTITLQSGEVLRGKILSESPTELTIEVPNANRTIFSKRTVNTTEIKDSTRQDKAERAAFETLCRHKLDPNQESTSNSCVQVLSGVDDFLAKYPKSAHCPEVRIIQARWQSEMRAVTSGQVKLDGQWMEPEERMAKKPIVDARQRVEAAKRGLEDVRMRKVQLIKDMAIAEQHLKHAEGYVESARNNPVRVPVYRTIVVREGYWGSTSSGARIYHERVTRQELDHYESLPNPDLPKLEQAASFYSGQVVGGKRELSGIDGRITDAERSVAYVEAAYSKAEADYNQTAASVRGKHGERNK